MKPFAIGAFLVGSVVAAYLIFKERAKNEKAAQESLKAMKQSEAESEASMKRIEEILTELEKTLDAAILTELKEKIRPFRVVN